MADFPFFFWHEMRLEFRCSMHDSLHKLILTHSQVQSEVMRPLDQPHPIILQVRGGADLSDKLLA